MPILSYIQRMNQLYGNETQVAGLPYRYGTQDTYSAPEELSPAPNWRDLIREEGVQVGEQVKDGGRIGFTPGGSADLEKEYYGSQKLDWMKNFPDLSWEEYLRYKSSGSFNKGGRVYNTRKYFKPGGLVEPGVTHYGDKKSSWNLGTGETGTQYLYRSRGGKKTGQGYYVKAIRGDEVVSKYFPPDEFEKAKAFAEKTKERFDKIPVKTRHLSGKKLTVANKYAQYLFEKDYKTLTQAQRDQIRATMYRQGDKFIKKSQYDLPSATNQEKIKNAFPDVEFDFKKGQRWGVPFSLKNGKRNPVFSAVAHFAKRGYVLPKQNIKKLPVSMQREIVSTFELPPGVKEWNFDVTRGGTRYGIPATAGENQALYQRIKYFTKDPRNFKIAADFAAPEGWLLGQMYRAWDAGHKNYKPIYDTINGKKKIVGFTDNQFGKGQTYFALKKYTKKFNGTPMSDHPDFKNTKKFIDIANRAKLPPNKVITDLLIKGGIEDNRVTLNTLLNYMVNEKGIEPTKRALVLHHRGGAKITPTRDLQILNRAINQNIMGIETKMRADPKNITPKNIQFLKDAGASVTIEGKTYGGGPKTAIGGFREAEKLVQSKLEGYGKKDFAKLKTYIEELGCGIKKAAGGRVGFQGGTNCFTKGQKKMNTLLISGAGTQAERSLLSRIIQGGAALLKGFSPKEMLKAKNLFGPAALGFMGAIETGLIADDVIRKNIPIKEALGKNWITGAFMPSSEEKYQVDEMRKQGLLINPGAKTYAKGIELQDKYNQLAELLSDLEDPVSGYKAIESKLAAELKVDSIADVRNEMEKIVNEYNKVTRDGVVMEEGSGAQLEFMQDFTEFEAKRATPNLFGELGTPLEPKIIRSGTRIGPGTAQQIEKDFTPQTYASTQISETPLPEESIRNVRDYLRHVGYIKPRDELPKAMVDYLQTQEKMTQAMKLPGMLGTQERFNTGGRVPFVKGKLVDEGRRAFMKWLAGITGAGIAAGTGLLKWGAGKGAGKTVIKAGDHIIQGTKGMPDWFIPLVNRIVKEGDDVTAKLATKEREIVHTKKINPNEEVTVYQNLDTGNVRVDYGPSLLDEQGRVIRASNDSEIVHLEYRAPEVIEEGKHVGKKTDPEFSAAEAEPEVVNWDGDIEWSGINEVNKVDDLVTDTNPLKQFATKKKPTMGEIVESSKKKKYQQKLQEDTMEQLDYIENKRGPFPDPSDYALDADEMAEVIPKWQGKASGGSVNYYDDYLPDIDDMDY